MKTILIEMVNSISEDYLQPVSVFNLFDLHRIAASSHWATVKLNKISIREKIQIHCEEKGESGGAGLTWISYKTFEYPYCSQQANINVRYSKMFDWNQKIIVQSLQHTTQHNPKTKQNKTKNLLATNSPITITHIVRSMISCDQHLILNSWYLLFIYVMCTAQCTTHKRKKKRSHDINAHFHHHLV